MPTKRADLGRPPAVRAEQGGKWVVCNAHQHTLIVDQADTFQDLWQAAQQMQVDAPILENVSRADVRFVGA